MYRGFFVARAVLMREKYLLSYYVNEKNVTIFKELRV